jgi:hypothetical protein
MKESWGIPLNFHKQGDRGSVGLLGADEGAGSGTNFTSVLGTIAKTATISSGWFPPYVVDINAILNPPPGTPTGPNIYEQVLQPAVQIEGGLADGNQWAPAGLPDPAAYQTNWMIAGLLGVGAVMGIFALGARWQEKRHSEGRGK